MLLVAIPLILTALARAQTPTQIPVFLLDTDPQSLVASVVDVQQATTTLQISCPPGGDASECGYGPGARVRIAANFADATMSVDGQFSLTWQCSITSSTVAATCTVSAGGPEANFPGVSTETLTGTDIQYIPVTITAGGEKLVTNGGLPDTTDTTTSTQSSLTTTPVGGNGGSSTLPQNTGSTTLNGPADPTNSPSSAVKLGSSGLLTLIAAVSAYLL